MISRKLLSLPFAFAAAMAASAVNAAEPATATLTDVDGKVPEITWTGAGPFLIPNVLATAGDPICDVPMTCDEFTLVVDISDEFRMDEANRRETVRIGITNATTTGQEDWDLYIYDSNGTMIASSAGAAPAQETASIPLATLKNGSYIVQAVPFTPVAATTYDGFARLGSSTSSKAEGSAFGGSFGFATLLGLLGLGFAARRRG